MGKWRYGVILDAGSSGTRVYIYRWLNTQRARKEASDFELNSLPQLQTKKRWTRKIHPGVSTFGEKPESVGPDHLKQLVDHALKYIPGDQVQDTPIFLLATAGMRLLPETQRNQVLDNICSYLQTTTKFQLPDCRLHIQVIPGETEGLYGWIAANYLLGAFDADAAETHVHGKDHHTYGFLDMGGASAQIAFAPNATEAEKHAEDLKLLRMRKVNGETLEYKVFVTTWLGYGVNEARRRYIDSLLTASPGIAELPDPCLPTGLELTKSGQAISPASHEAVGKETYLLGTGKFPECLSKTYPLLDKDAPCLDPPCLLHGVHVPAIDFDVNHFVGVSEYWHTTHEIFEMAHKDKAYDFNTYQQRVLEFCSQDWKSIQKGVKKQKWGKVTEEQVADVCFKASWLINMLHDGIGIPRVGLEPTKGGHNGTKAVIDGAKEKGFLDPFQAVDKIDDVEVSWTLGKMVLYAASQVPGAEDKALAVGFGSNVPGPNLPKDFQFAGGSSIPLPTDPKDDVDWHDKLFTSSSSRRLPGFLLFLVILLVAAFLLCGRDRRNSLLKKVGLSPGKGGKRKNNALSNGLGKLFGNSSGPSYDRVLEGGNGPDPSDFELDDINEADSDSDNSNGRTSGWATPKLNSNGFSSPVLHSSPRSARVNLYNGHQPAAGYFDGPPTHASSNLSLATTPGLQLPGGRGGLLARTESREQIATATLRSGSRSRAASPSRLRSPLVTPLKESSE